MKILMVGDLHGRNEIVANIDQWAIRNEIELVIQCGDFGVHWPGAECRIAKYFQDNKEGPPWLVTLGNHDNYDKFRLKALPAKDYEFPSLFKAEDPLSDIEKIGARCYLLGRNTVVTLDDLYRSRLLFFGGAVSTDAHHRVQGKSWWPEEAPTYSEFARFFNLLQERIDIVVTHDRPLLDAFKGEFEPAKNDISKLPVDYVAKTFREIIEQLVSSKQLSAWGWFHGHIHEIRKTNDFGVTFYGTGYHGSGWFLDTDIGIPPTHYFNVHAATKTKVFPYSEIISQGDW